MNSRFLSLSVLALTLFACADDVAPRPELAKSSSLATGDVVMYALATSTSAADTDVYVFLADRAEQSVELADGDALEISAGGISRPLVLDSAFREAKNRARYAAKLPFRAANVEVSFVRPTGTTKVEAAMPPPFEISRTDTSSAAGDGVVSWSPVSIESMFLRVPADRCPRGKELHEAVPDSGTLRIPKESLDSMRQCATSISLRRSVTTGATGFAPTSAVVAEHAREIDIVAR